MGNRHSRDSGDSDVESGNAHNNDPGPAPNAEQLEPVADSSTPENGGGGGGGRRQGVKRKDSELSDLDRLLHTPKKKKLKTTSRYIYETLFLEGRGSDICVTSMGKEWKLHKHYLCQSPYFDSMFNGNWRESTMDHINISVVDPNITVESLDVALGALYQDELTIQPTEVMPILAAATLFQIEGLIVQCLDIMEETINIETVVEYHDMANEYGALGLKNLCMKWLKVNLLSHMPEHPEKLRRLPATLLKELIASADLFVMQTEFSVYVLLRLWLYLVKHPNWDGSPQDVVNQSHRYFQERAETVRSYYLETPDGIPYASVFKQLRLTHLVNHHMDMDMLLKDRIIPKKWMHKVYRQQWQTMLKVDQGIDKGPKTMSEEEFNENCMRCGRTLNSPGQGMWRWTGFNMGLDLIITYDNGNLSVKRSLQPSGSTEHDALLSNHPKRHFNYKVIVASLNDQKQVAYEANSGVKSVTLGKNGKTNLLKIDTSKAAFPLLLSFSFAVTTPLQDQDDLDDEDEEEVPHVEQEVEDVPA